MNNNGVFIESNFINLTPHDVTIVFDDAPSIVFVATHDTIPRATQTSEEIGRVNVDGSEIPIVQTSFGEVTDLPEKRDGVFLIVSAIVANACPDRDDLVIPNDLVRDEKGVIIGARSFARVR